jgi:23S rRNA pseudouridine2605 synthase
MAVTLLLLLVLAVFLSHQGCVSFPSSSVGTMFHRLATGAFASKSRLITFNPLSPNGHLVKHGGIWGSASRLYMSKGKRKTGGLLRADRVLSNRGWGSRSECFDLLKQRRVYQKVESVMTKLLGPSEKISMDASLWVDAKHEVARPPPLLRIYHKPKWVLSVMNDSKGRRNLADLDFISKMHPVGRLDYDTSGLLLFSSDGALTQMLLHPSHGIQKEYVAVVTGKVDEENLRNVLKEGVATGLGVFTAELIEATPIPDEEVKATSTSIINNLPPEYDLEKLEEKGFLFFKKATEMSQVRLVVSEGKHRMVRKILANSGYPVVSLKRERLGDILLEGVEEGGYRDLTPQEEKWAKVLMKNEKKNKKLQSSSKETDEK